MGLILKHVLNNINAKPKTFGGPAWSTKRLTVSDNGKSTKSTKRLAISNNNQSANQKAEAGRDVRLRQKRSLKITQIR